MAHSPSPEEIELHEHYFRDPKVGEGYLKPPCTGLACRNLRLALNRLGYDIPITDIYDAQLSEFVKRFQADFKHPNIDGVFGRGTRRLLTRVMLEQNDRFYERGFVSPEYAVFLSYSRGDEALVTPLANGLRNRGLPVFQDLEAIPSGQYWPDVLYRSIQKCQVFLCFVSEHSCTSVNVLIEIALAIHAEKPILPITLAPVNLPPAFQSLIGGIQQLHLSHSSPEQRIEQILQPLSHFGL